MRLRNVKGSREKIQKSSYVVESPEQYKGNWKELFGNENPIHIEIGMGKGQFIMELARRNPEINYIGIEKFSSVLVRALEKRETEEMENLIFIRMDAENIVDVFEKGEVEQIYMNFSDPWPKDRHAKRRLTSRQFLERYEKIINKGSFIIFKTDNRSLFEFSLNEITESGWTIHEKTFDLHNSKYVQGNIMTEYEQKFVSENKPIHMLVASQAL